MAGSSFGKNFRISTFGESHGKALGVIIDGVPAGLELSEDKIMPYLERRRPGKNIASTARNEADKPEILSGVFEGKTTGTPICVIVRNADQHSKDYSEIADKFRPGHADFGFETKFGIRDYRGGGRSSGRETVARVIGGAVASLILKELGINVLAYTYAIDDVEIDPSRFNEEYLKTSTTGMPDSISDLIAVKRIESARAEGDSLGSVVECRINGLMPGIGEPVFDKLDAMLAHAVFSIGAVKGFEIGDGTQASKSRGSKNNDPFVMGEDGKVNKKKNSAGGILGGISDGSEIVCKAYFKPTPSISKPQDTVDSKGNDTPIVISGRHDPVIGPRAAVVVESMCAMTVLDLIIDNMSSKLDDIRTFYK